MVGGPFAGLVAAPAEARRPPNAADARRRSRTCATAQVRLHLPQRLPATAPFHDTEVAGDARRRHRRCPGRHDGMGAFPGPNGNVLLVRNHEVTNNPNTPAFGPGHAVRREAPGAGTTTVEVTTLRRGGQAPTPASTARCSTAAAAIMPWGSWITCEETVNGPDVGPDFTGSPNTGLQQPHGYVFEVPEGRAERPAADHARRAVRPRGGAPSTRATASSTSPRTTSSSRPASTATSRRGNPMQDRPARQRGQLQMLAVKGEPNAHLEARQPQAGDLPASPGSTSRTPTRRSHARRPTPTTRRW